MENEYNDIYSNNPLKYHRMLSCLIQLNEFNPIIIKKVQENPR